MSIRNFFSRFNVSVFPQSHSAQGTEVSRYLILDHELSRRFRFFFLLQPLFFSLELVPHRLRLFRRNFQSLFLALDVHSFRLHPTGFLRMGARGPSSVPRHSVNIPFILPGFSPNPLRREVRRFFRGRNAPRFIQNIATVAYFPLTSSNFYFDHIGSRPTVPAFFRLVARREVSHLRLHVMPRSFIRIESIRSSSSYLEQFIRYVRFAMVLLGNSLLFGRALRLLRGQLFDYTLKFFLGFRLYIQFLLGKRNRFRFTGPRSPLLDGVLFRFFMTRHFFPSRSFSRSLGRMVGRIDRSVVDFSYGVSLIYAASRYGSSLIAKYAAGRLQIGYRVREVLTHHFLASLRRTTFGFRFVIKGRFSKKLRADYLVFTSGNCPLGTFSLPIDYAQAISVTKYGTSSVKCWIHSLPPHSTGISTPYSFRGYWYLNGSVG